MAPEKLHAAAPLSGFKRYAALLELFPV